MIERKIESVTDAGHPDIGGDIKPIGDKISKKLKENILSGRWSPSNIYEIRMLREHLESQEKRGQR